MKNKRLDRQLVGDVKCTKDVNRRFCDMVKNMTEEKRKQYQKVKEKWKSENTFHFSVRLQNTTDADLIERISACPSKQGELKRLARLGIEYEKKMKGET